MVSRASGDSPSLLGRAGTNTLLFNRCAHQLRMQSLKLKAEIESNEEFLGDKRKNRNKKISPMIPSLVFYPFLLHMASPWGQYFFFPEVVVVLSICWLHCFLDKPEALGIKVGW